MNYPGLRFHMWFRFALVLVLLSIASSVSAQPYIPGEVYFGRNQYIAYYPGDLPIVFSAPHGGNLTPDEIPDRTYGTTATDRGVREVALAVRGAVFALTGRYPHIIVSHLKRTKLDPNREIVEAAQGSVWAEQAWNEYHGFIETARETITSQHGKGMYVDLHGHSHAIQRLELDYHIARSDLFRSNAELNSIAFINTSNIRALGTTSNLPFSQLLRGPSSLGALFENAGIPAVPSLSQPDPGAGNPYFWGGYSPLRHGSIDGGVIDGLMIEAHYVGLRDTPASRTYYARVITDVFDEFFRLHYGWDGIVTGTEGMSGMVASAGRLLGSYPNPFRETTTVEYTVAHAGPVDVVVFDMLGREVAVLERTFVTAGIHTVRFDAHGLASGVYMVSVTYGKSIRTKLIVKSAR